MPPLPSWKMRPAIGYTRDWGPCIPGAHRAPRVRKRQRRAEPRERPGSTLWDQGSTRPLTRLGSPGLTSLRAAQTEAVADDVDGILGDQRTPGQVRVHLRARDGGLLAGAGPAELEPI